MFQAQVFTLYPEVFPGPLAQGLYGKALSNKLWSLNIINIRDSAIDKHKTVDDTPYGGGTGMLLKADVLANSLDQKLKKGERAVARPFVVYEKKLFKMWYCYEKKTDGYKIGYALPDYKILQQGHLY